MPYTIFSLAINSTRRLAFLATAVIAALVTTACTQLDQETLAGILQEVDSVSGQVEVQLKDGSTVTFDLDEVDPQVVAGAIGSASLESGDPVEVEVTGDGEVKAARARHAKAEGVIESVSGETIAITARNGVGLEVSVTPETKIEVEGIDDDSATLSDLQPGVEVEVKYDPETNVAFKIEVEEEDDHEDRSGHRDGERKVHGAISSVDVEAAEVTVLTADGEEVVLAISPETEIEGTGSPTLDSLSAGLRVEARYNPDTGVAREIEVEEEEEHDDHEDHEHDDGGHEEEEDGHHDEDD